MAATVVWCNKCKTAVWAYDQMREGQDVRGFLNMSSIPCPKCGEVANFDGWSGDVVDFKPPLRGVYDNWSLLKYIFGINCKDGIWAISPDCSWFKRPDTPDDKYDALMNYIQEGITTARED